MPLPPMRARTTSRPMRRPRPRTLRRQIDEEPSAVRPLGRHAQVRGEQFWRRAAVLRCQCSLHAVTYSTQHAHHYTVAVGDRGDLAQDATHPSEEILTMRHVERRDGFQAKPYLAK